MTAVYVDFRITPLSYFVRAGHARHAEELRLICGAATIDKLRTVLLERVPNSDVSKWVRGEVHIDMAKLSRPQ